MQMTVNHTASSSAGVTASY